MILSVLTLLFLFYFLASYKLQMVAGIEVNIACYLLNNFILLRKSSTVYGVMHISIRCHSVHFYIFVLKMFSPCKKRPLLCLIPGLSVATCFLPTESNANTFIRPCVSHTNTKYSLWCHYLMLQEWHLCGSVEMTVDVCQTIVMTAHRSVNFLQKNN